MPVVRRFKLNLQPDVPVCVCVCGNDPPRSPARQTNEAEDMRALVFQQVVSCKRPSLRANCEIKSGPMRQLSIYLNSDGFSPADPGAIVTAYASVILRMSLNDDPSRTVRNGLNSSMTIVYHYSQTHRKGFLPAGASDGLAV